MNVFISGGCKNGKSYHAQELARDMAQQTHAPLYYLATMIPCDKEDEIRICRHMRERAGWGFDTIEQGRNICECLPPGRGARTLSGTPVHADGVFLLDSVTALLSNEMFLPDGQVDLTAPQRLAEQLADFAARTGNTVFVSDYIYADARLQNDYTEAYRRGLAYIDRHLARICDQVIEVAFGMKYAYK